MTEHIELQPLRKNQCSHSDSEEYHEISHEPLQETLLSPKHPVTPVKEYDFFTQHDTRVLRKHSTKKKKSKKKQTRPKALVDVISTELAGKQYLVENSVVMIDAKECNNYLRNDPIQEILKSGRSSHTDTETGLNLRTDHISPVFPSVLENNMNKEVNIIPVQYIEPLLFSDIATEYLESGTKQTPKFLDVVLRNINFNHHHEFCLEKLCSLKLIEYYKRYEAATKLLKDISKNVNINRTTRNNLKEKLLKINANGKEDVRFDKNVLKYTKNMLELKEKYYHTLEEQKSNVHLIMSIWADIETIREKSGLTKTDCTLQITNTEVEQSEYEKQWNQLFQIEYSDLIVSIEYEFINNYLQYKESKRRQIDNVDEGNKIVKPKLEIDYEKLKIEVESLVNSLVLRNKIDIFLKRDRPVLKRGSNKRKESLGNSYRFKIYVDDLFVCESDNYICKNDQSDIHFIEHLSIEILPHNEFMNIILFENDDEMSSYKTQLSDIKKNCKETSYKYNFVFDKTLEPTAKYIGCGYDIKEIAARHRVRLKSSNIFRGKLQTRCDVNIQLSWSDKYNDNHIESIKSSMDIGRRIKQLLLGKNKPHLNEITEIINNLYDNDIADNEKIMAALEDITTNKSRFKTNHDFSFDESDSKLTRFKLLHLRNCGGFSDLENKIVPLYTSQMSTELLECLQKSEQEDIGCHNFKRETENNSIDVQRFIGMKFVEKLNGNIMKKINDLLLTTTFKDVVRDFEDLSFRSLFTNQINMTLGAGASASKRQHIKDCLMKEQEIHVTVLRAYNLSARSADTVAGDESDCDDIAGYKVHPLRPFVRISYHGTTAQTATAIGQHPSWNHALKIKTRLEPLSSLHINIYDQCKEHVSDKYSDEHAAQSTVIYRKYNRWLGAINIPIHAVLRLGNVRGMFKLSGPPLLFGYENTSFKQSESAFSEVNRLMKKESSFLALQVTTSMSHLGGYQTYRQPVSNEAENDFTIRHLNEFITEYNNDFPTRNISLSFIDSTGRNRCVSEFLQAIPVPDYQCFPLDPKKTESALSKSSGYSRSSSSKSSRMKSVTDDDGAAGVENWRKDESQLLKYMDAVVRYVSLVPAYEVTDTHSITLMGAELLKVLYGSPLDHSILLASYFLYLEIKCWIIIGYALPRGLSSYVLVQHCYDKLMRTRDQIKARWICGGTEGFVWYIYDAVAGERYELREIGCPLKTVSYVFNSENIWVNIQTAQDCESVSFNFTKSSDWQTVFNKPLFVARHIIDSLYSKPEDVEGLRISLEMKIKIKIQKWRSHVKTIWNRYCSNLLREMLPHWEYWSFNPTTPRSSPGHRLKQLMATYKIYGFPLNMPYLNSKLIISNIKSTAIHVNENPNVEFGLGVEVYAYPNNVLSVWVFLACITRI